MKPVWRKRLKNAGWITLAVAGVVLLAAGVERKNRKKCTDIKVELGVVKGQVFLDEKEVLDVLNATGVLTGKPVEEINLQVLEKRLENDPWIRNAELFFDNKQVLQARVEEREPIARIFTVAGSSYYIDSSGHRLPLSSKVMVRVPVFTNFPSEQKKLLKKDSLLMVWIKDMATFIQGDSFWNAQVAQVYITPNRTFEMVPVVGNHLVILGNGEDIEQKFKRLYTFYKQVWLKAGLEKYSTVNVQFKGQVVAERKESYE